MHAVLIRKGRRAPRRDDGFTSLWVLGLTMIVFALGIAVFDVWKVYSTQRQLTALADAASAAGAQAIDVTRYQDDGTIILKEDDAACRAVRRLQEDIRGSGSNCTTPALEEDTTVTVVTGPAAGPPTTVTVEVTRTVHFTVFSMLGRSSHTVTASSTASPRAG